MNILELIGRNNELFDTDILKLDQSLNSIVNESRFLVLGGAGSIGQAVVKQIFKRNVNIENTLIRPLIIFYLRL